MRSPGRRPLTRSRYACPGLSLQRAPIGLGDRGSRVVVSQDGTAKLVTCSGREAGFDANVLGIRQVLLEPPGEGGEVAFGQMAYRAFEFLQAHGCLRLDGAIHSVSRANDLTARRARAKDKPNFAVFLEPLYRTPPLVA